MKPTEPLELFHSWPLFDQDRRFDLGHAFPASPFSQALKTPIDEKELARLGIGVWECDLADNALTWSAGVYDLFGLPRGAHVRREEAVALYCETSRSTMERLRAYAIKHRRGFTLDVEIRPALTQRRWMRLIAAPVCEGLHVTHLHGLKLIV